LIAEDQAIELLLLNLRLRASGIHRSFMEAGAIRPGIIPPKW
jgi:hypothetical protein